MRAAPGDGPSRWADYDAEGIPPPFPDLGDDVYLARAFSMAGECTVELIPMSDQVTHRPLTWQEIHAFRIETGAISHGWESETIMEMSRAYCNEAVKAKEPLRIPPMERGKPKDAYTLAASD